jgi:GTP-binding protein
MTEPLALTFVLSADTPSQLPDSPAEVALVGRSNVGKSSLLNALAHRNQLARTSKTPGRTRLLNCFRLPNGATVLDLPGYGYAKVSARERDAWRIRLGTYLRQREPLVMTLVLVDGTVGPTTLDQDLLGWLREFDLPFTVVATKHDKVKSSQRVKRRRDLARGCGVDPSQVVWVSAKKGTNIGLLRGLIRSWLDGAPATAPE